MSTLYPERSGVGVGDGSKREDTLSALGKERGLTFSTSIVALPIGLESTLLGEIKFARAGSMQARRGECGQMRREMILGVTGARDP